MKAFTIGGVWTTMALALIALPYGGTAIPPAQADGISGATSYVSCFSPGWGYNCSRCVDFVTCSSSHYSEQCDPIMDPLPAEDCISCRTGMPEVCPGDSQLWTVTGCTGSFITSGCLEVFVTGESSTCNVACAVGT